MTLSKLDQALIAAGDPLSKSLKRIAMDIQEHPEWPYWVIAAYIRNSLALAGFTVSIPVDHIPSA
jgi:hypothetical protein